MKKCLILACTFALGFFILSCSGDTAASGTESAASDAATKMTEAVKEKGAAMQKSIDELAFDKFQKNLKKRGIELTEAQITSLKAAIADAGLTKDNFKQKRTELVEKIKSDILTEDQKPLMSK
ncbi:MAG: hypothetical protein RIC19_17875 [Phaeodactylibacter sp.]|uniref:hypothetical protein n=1 Tax=Phaeodactylibacter sp. TaxID=1940289 RepID=UPI0032EC188C